MKVLVLSCDKYESTWYPFFTLYERYFPNDYKTYLVTETKSYNGYESINTSGQWTKRIREALKKITDDYVLILLDDFFIRERVDIDRIEQTLELFDDNTAGFNFEYDYDNNPPSEHEGWNIKHKQAQYKCSCQAGIWDRKKLIELLHGSRTAWEWEIQGTNKDYKFYINNTKQIINYGYHNHQWFGICKGKWVMRDVVPLFDKEGIKVDYGRM